MKMEWINVKDRLPPNDCYVLVALHHCHKKSGMETYFIHIALRMNQEWFDDHNGENVEYKDRTITHWMPLPDKPGVKVG